MVIVIRPEEPGDKAQIRTVNEQAFGQPLEADLVDALRRNCSDRVSLVAVVDEHSVVGHILFTPVTLDAATGRITGMGLAPMAVLPARQRQGIGSALVRQGLETLAARGCPFVIVVGHPEYYPRFGFEPASSHDLRCQWDGVPDQAFMVRILDEGKMRGASGLATYRDEFSTVA